MHSPPSENSSSDYPISILATLLSSLCSHCPAYPASHFAPTRSGLVPSRVRNVFPLHSPTLLVFLPVFLERVIKRHFIFDPKEWGMIT